jgi:hypothetical protein
MLWGGGPGWFAPAGADDDGVAMGDGRVMRVTAADIGEGYRIVQPDGTATAPVMSVEWTDFDEVTETAARAVLFLDDGDELDLPGDAVLSAIWHEDATDVPLTRPRIVGDDADPVVVLLREIVEAHAGDPEVERLAARVSRGFTTPSGLEGVARLASMLCLRLDDSGHALAVCRLISAEQYSGDHDRWTWVARALGLVHHIALASGTGAAQLAAPVGLCDGWTGRSGMPCRFRFVIGRSAEGSAHERPVHGLADRVCGAVPGPVRFVGRTCSTVGLRSVGELRRERA